MRVAHPHVVAPHGWAAEDDDVLLTMDLVAGGSVSTLLDDYGRLPVPVVAVLLDQLLDALVAVHAAGLVHRDVKPGNLLLEPTGTGPPYLRLADFGIAVALDDHRLTATGMVVGTPGYVAPEVMRTGAVDPRQDLWAVGVLARHMLTGVAPGSTSGGLPLPHADRPDWPQEVPGGLVALLEAMAEDDPADRPPDATAARATLRALALRRGGQPAGEEIEVFDHLAALPVGWTRTGPAARPSTAAADATPSPSRTSMTSSPLTTSSPPPVSPRPGHDPPVRTQVQPTPTQPVAAGSGPGREATAAVHTPAAARPRGRRFRTAGRTWQLVAAAVLTLAAVTAFVLAATAGDPGSTNPPEGPRQSTSEGALDVVAGDECDFTDAGLSAEGADGDVLTCALRSGRYTWG